MNPTLSLVARRFAGVVLIATVICAPLRVWAADENDKAHDELRQLKTLYETAINTGDLAPLEALFTPESSGVVVDNQPYRSFAELKAIYDRFHATFPNVVYRVKLDPQLSQLFGDIAVASGSCEEYVKTAAGEFTYTSTWTAVLRKTNGQWKLVRSQVTMDPFSNSIVRHFQAKSKQMYGGGGLLLGLLVGFVASRALRPKAVTA